MTNVTVAYIATPIFPSALLAEKTGLMSKY